MNRVRNSSPPSVRHTRSHSADAEDQRAGLIIAPSEKGSLEEMSPKQFHDHNVQAPSLNDKWWKFIILVTGIMFFFGCHNYMQELIMRLPGFKVISDANFLFFAFTVWF
jgi:hypothetical protein